MSCLRMSQSGLIHFYFYRVVSQASKNIFAAFYTSELVSDMSTSTFFLGNTYKYLRVSDCDFSEYRKIESMILLE